MQICCSICKDIFIPHSEVMVTKCGHLYHDSCISEWCKRHMTCPQCRSKLKEKAHRVYFDVENDTDTDPSSLQYKIDKLIYNLQVKETETKKLKDAVEEKESMLVALRQHALDVEVQVEHQKEISRALKKELNHILDLKATHDQMKKEYELMKSRADTLEKVERLVRSTVEEVNKMVASTPVTPSGVRQLCTYVEALKLLNHKMDVKRSNAKKEMDEIHRELLDAEKEKQKLFDQVNVLTTVNEELQEEINSLKSILHKKEMEVDVQPDYAEKTTSPVWQKVRHNKDLKGNRRLLLANSTDSSDVLDGLSFQLGAKKPRFNLNSKIINNLEAKDKKHDSIVDSSVMESVAGPSKITFKPPSISSNTSIFNKRSASSTSTSERSNMVFDGMGGSKKINLATPSPREELAAALLNQKLKKKPRRNSHIFKTPPTPTHTIDGFFS